MSLVELATLGLATWRLASLIRYERGPGSIFEALRAVFGIIHDADGGPMSWPDTEMGRLLRCLDCATIWVGLGLVGLYLVWPVGTLVLAAPLALSAIAIALEVMISGTRKH